MRSARINRASESFTLCAKIALLLISAYWTVPTYFSNAVHTEDTFGALSWIGGTCFLVLAWIKGFTDLKCYRTYIIVSIWVWSAPFPVRLIYWTFLFYYNRNKYPESGISLKIYQSYAK